MSELTRFFECECCERETCADKKPGLGYLCDPCVKCFSADPPLTGDEPLPPGVSCYFVDDLSWMQSQVRTSEYNRQLHRDSQSQNQALQERAEKAEALLQLAEDALAMYQAGAVTHISIDPRPTQETDPG